MSKNEDVVEAVEVDATKEEKAPSLAEQVKGVEAQVVQAMLQAAEPILTENGFTGFKDVSLVATPPDEEGNVRQSIRVIL